MRGFQSPFCNRPARLLRNITAAALILCLVLYHIPDRTWRGAQLLFFGAHWEKFPLWVHASILRPTLLMATLQARRLLFWRSQPCAIITS